MINTGQILITAQWDGEYGCVSRVDCQRLPVAGLLHGRTLDEAFRWVPTLYSLCARAQSSVARAALLSARLGRPVPDMSVLGRVGLATEAVRELLWRILLDWPALYGQEARRAQYAQWHRSAGRILQALGDQARLQSEDCVAAERVTAAARAMGQQLLDCPLRVLMEFNQAGNFGSCCLGELIESGCETAFDLFAMDPETSWQVNPGTDVGQLPEAGSTQLMSGFEVFPDAVFCKAPVWQGWAAETGAWVRRHAHVGVQKLWNGDVGRPSGLIDRRGQSEEAWQDLSASEAHGGSMPQKNRRTLTGSSTGAADQPQVRQPARIAARLFAQVVDLAAWARVLIEPESTTLGICHAACSDGFAMASCETARGTLMHLARVDTDRIVDYAIIAPTDWNFAPEGVLRQEGRFAADNEASARAFLTALTLALNPCMPFELRLETSDHA